MEGEREHEGYRRGYYSEAITNLNSTLKGTLQGGAFKKTKLLWQVRTEHHAPIISSLDPPKKRNFLAPAERWMCYDEEKSICFPVDTFEPKVQMQHEIIPFVLPRNVAIERKRRQYQERTIKECLNQLKVNTRKLIPYNVLWNLEPEEEKYGLYPKVNYLPLDLFDDEEYDARTPEGWLNHGLLDGVRHPLPGEAYLPREIESNESLSDKERQLQYIWTNVAVLDYIPEKTLWNVITLDGKQRPYHIPRIYLMFKAEDPVVFAKRIKAAIDLRDYTESVIRYEFYLDCITLTGVYDINDGTWQLMFKLATRGKKIFRSQHVVDIEQEVRLNHRRALGEMEFRDRAHKQPYVYSFLTIPKRDEMKVPAKGFVETGMKNFKKRLTYFRWMNIYVVEHTHRAMCLVVGECMKVAQMCLFTTGYGKNVTLGEFTEIQTQTTNNLIKHLKTSWLDTTAFNIRMCLGYLGKGWFNLNEKQHEIYDTAKLVRFMGLVKYHMQYGLRLLVKNSVKVFTQLVETPCQPCLVCQDDFVWGTDLINSPFRPTIPTIFTLILNMNDNGPYYNTDPNLFDKTLLRLYDTAITLTHTVKQVHPQLLTELRFPSDLTLSSVGLLEDFVCQFREQFMLGYKKAIIPLKAYAKQFVPYLEFYTLDIANYVEQFKEFGAPEVKEEVSFQLKMKWNLETTLPASIIIGPFLIFTNTLKDFLVNKRQEIATKLLNQFAKRMKELIEQLIEEYHDIEIKLKEKPNSIEHIFDIRDWIETVPMTVRGMEEQARRLLIEYDILDTFWYNLPDEEFENKWEVIGWPRKIVMQVDQTNDFLVEETDKFQKIQYNDEMQLTDKIEQLSVQVAKLSAQRDFAQTHDIAVDMRRLWKQMKEAQEQGQLLNQRQRLFGMPVIPFENLTRLMREFQPYKDLWITASDWLRNKDIWLDNPLVNVDSESIERITTDMQKMMIKLVRTFQDIPAVQAVAGIIRDQIEQFKPLIPLIQALRNPGMRERHWKEFGDQTGIPISITAATTFDDCLDLGILPHAELIVIASDTASKEYGIEQIMDKMVTDWENAYLELTPYKRTGTFIVKVSEDIQQMLDDHLVLTQQISFSPFKAAFENRIDEWEQSLRVISEVFEEWMDVQRQWMYLEPIFTSEDIKTQLPNESKKYGSMERSWKRIMRNAYDCPKIIEFCPDKKLLESLKDANHMLEIVEKGLAEYLERKRSTFPRMFFLSDDELLEILSQARNPLAVQPHLKKCFENIARLTFEEDLHITQMFSAEDECVDLRPTLYPKGNVECWMLVLEENMKSTMRLTFGDSYIDLYKKPRQDWVLLWPGQIVIACSQTYWTAEVENGLRTSTLPNFFNVMLKNLDALRSLVKGSLTFVQREVLCALIVIEVHSRDVTQTLLDNNVQNINDFDWISQLRYYWIDSEVKVRAVNAEFPYGYEYLGNSGRLVITPLTDRCYLTLTGALHLKFGGAPAGPAGTGKTETTKDLAKAFARQCVVFNCSDQLDFMAMGKFFKGLASSGAWACFDEFNRIDIEVLSVVAQQIMTIQKAQQARLDRFLFEGTEIVLKESCAVFITMNPGYAGRTELPDNLKALFRPVAMMVPNYSLIAEISLFSFGFSGAKQLANKITTTFKLSSEQLSTQDHYDFGMRAVKTVIAVAGNLKREKPDMNENQIILRSLSDVNVPKFLKDDLKLFNGIVSDLFPRMVEEVVDHGALEEAIRSCIRSRGLEDVDEFVRKVIQLYETTIVRHGLMLVGPTGSGKTKCYIALQDAMTTLKGQPSPSGYPFQAVHTYVTNPKSITMGQLYGEFDLQTHEWTDGILPSLVRVGINAENKDKRWYIFDGPVDAVWIENMNTVLDDNKKLCLSSGEIIKLRDTMTMMFEVADLAVASPATVSRCGMVYLEPGVLGLEPFINCWILRLPQLATDYADKFRKLYEIYLLPAVELLRSSMREILTSVDSALVLSFLRLMDQRLSPLSGKDNRPPPSAQFLKLIPKLLVPWIVFSLTWTVGCTCDHNGRKIFSQWLKDTMAQNRHEPQFPSKGFVYDYKLHDGGFTNPTDDGEPAPPKWQSWMDNIEDIKITLDMKYSDMEVPTIHSVRNAELLGMILLNEDNVLCVGPTGTGKTLTVIGKLSKNMHKKFICDFITFSARTSANQTQDLLDSKLDRRRRGVFGPPVLKRQIFFIDDFNMPALEVFGAQPPIELIRQWMDFGGWYDRKNIGDFRTIIDVNFVAAMGPPGGGRNPVTARLLRHFHYLGFTELDEESKEKIFGTILNFWINRTPEEQYFGPVLLKATLSVYTTLLHELLPTPAKTHYTFNLRDLSKVFQGLLMMEPETVQDLDHIIRLWYHENCRVYQDRLINDKDRNWFAGLLQQKIQANFKRIPDEALGTDAILFGDFLDPNTDIRNYIEITDMNELSNVLDQYLFDYNSQSTRPMKLVLFLDAIAHVCRIARIIRQPMGNGLLLGMGGSGRQSLTRLSAHMAEFYCFQIELTSAYSSTDWKEDIKGLMLEAGLYNKESVFLFSDTQIKSELFLEDLNSILNSGDVPNIYQPDELDKIFQGMKGAVQEMGLTATKSNLFSVYQKSVRTNLHTVISMSPIGELFRARLRQFPALVNCCTIDWFSAWPDAALQSVALQFLEEIPDLNEDPEVFQGIVVMCQFMHASVVDASSLYRQELSRYNYVTPTLYLQLLSSYTDLMNKKKADLSEGVNRLTTGLGKLQITAAEVKVLQQDLELMKPALEVAAKEAEEMIVQIAADTEIAEETKQLVEKEEAEASKKQIETQNIAEDAQRDLDAALPALEAAERSLQALNKNDITEVRAMKRPPRGVIYVIESLCIVKGIKPKGLPGPRPGEKIYDYWEPGRNMLSDPGQFLSSLMNFDKDSITEDMITKLQKYVDDPGYQPDKISKVSKACTSFCMWVHAMYKYYFVNLQVAPKKAALVQAKAELAMTEKKLAESQARMRAVQKRLDALNKKLQARIEFKEEKQRSITLCEERLSRAHRLIAGLAGERIRWIETINNIENNLVNITGDILISSGSVAYLTNFTDKYRRGLLSEWYRVMSEHKIPHTENSNPVNILGEPVQIRQWQLEGLPRDYLSTENAVLVSCSRRWPLFIDPQAQANKWVKNMCKPKGLSICKQADKDLLRTLESAIRFGKPVLIENVAQDLDPALDPILNRSVFKQSGQLMIKLGDAVIPYNEDFQLFITTKLANPHYSPEVSIKVLLVNFTLVPSGLEDQLLGIVVMQERPDLEEMRSAIVVSIAQMKQELKEIQDRILYKLSVSEGSPLDDIEFIVMLEASKVKSEDIKMKVEVAEITQTDIDNTRALYVPVANRGQILFFCLADLANVDPMYQYSLEWFVSIFIGSMVNTEKSENLDERVTTINDYFTFSLYTNVCRSLFEKHKLHFAFLMCIRILMDMKQIDPHEWHHFLAGGQPALDITNPCPDWLSTKAWNEILALASLPTFKEFVTTFADHKLHYKDIFDSVDPHRQSLPDSFQDKYHDFQKMIVLKSLRPDKVTNSMQDFLTNYLGARFVEPQSSDLMEMFKESGPIIPLIFVLSTGTDPAADLFKFADRMRMSKRMMTISLGQGQGPRAEAMIKESIEVGSWVFFQNCHLAPSWMPRLERLIETLQPESVHKDFRIWLTSTPSPFFPVSILQNGCKMTVEPPRGIKANMLRAYQSQVTDFLDFIASAHEKVFNFKYLLFSLCLFHAILLERRKFGPLGFNIPYEFTDGDLKICISQLHMFLMEYDEIPFKVLLYTAGQINYGGRVTDDWDRRCLMNILFDYYNINVVQDGYVFDKQKCYYQLASDTAYIDYIDYIKTFPLNDDPEAFGMHANADISCAQALTYACLATLLMLQPKQVGGAAASQEEVIASNANAILKSVPKQFDLAFISEKYPVLYEESLNTVIIQEAIRYNNLLEVIISSLNDLLKALKGLVVMSEALERMSNSLFSNIVPMIWSTKAYPSLKPLAAWVTDLQARCRFLDEWIDYGIPSAFWISGFYFPQAFLTGTLQNYARKYIVSIDTINFSFRVLSAPPLEKPVDGCIIYGLFLEGSRWNSDLMLLDESKPKELYTDMPHIWLLPEENHEKPTETYDCPTYKTLTRAGTLSTTGHSTNYVLAIELPSAEAESHWITRGVALICALDY